MAKSNAKGKGGFITVAGIIAIIASVLLIIVIAIGAAGFYFFHFDLNGTIMENVYIADVNVGGMTRKEAISAVNQTVGQTLQSEPMIVKVFDVAVEISPEASKVKLNTTFAVWDAYSYGRRGFSSQKAADQQQAANGGIAVDLSRYIRVSKAGVEAALDEFSNHYNTTLTQSTYEVTGTAPALTLVVHLGIPEYGLDLNVLLDEVIKTYHTGSLLLETECALLPPQPIDLEAIQKEYSTEAVDAYYDKETFDVIDEVNGCKLDIDAAQEKIEATAYGETVEIPFDQIKPETTGEVLRARLFCDVLGNHTATQSSSSSRETNLRLACEAINGVILFPGDTFSYNETLGERTTERGYKTGIAYVGGESVPSIGGGICQVSSTLYYCALQADLEIIARENHCYAPGYVPLGMDATVSWGALDFCFRNNKDYPIRIDAVADGGSTTVTLMGTDTKDYYIKMEYVVTGSYSPETIYKEMPADNEKGYKDGDVITSPAYGYDVVTYRCKYDKVTNELISKDFEAKSHFSKKDKVICKIISDTPTAAPTGPADGTEPTTPGIGNGGVSDGDGSLPD